MIAFTIPDLIQLRKLAYFYAITRIIEVSIIGMILYFFYYEEFYLASVFLNFDANISEITSPRLLSIGTANSNDAAFALLGALGLLSYRFLSRFRVIDVILSLVALVGLLLTWTRSVWPFVFIYLALVLSLNKRINKFAILTAGIFLLGLSVLAFQLFEARKDSDDRLQSADNAYIRQQQFIDYISAIPNMPFFWGRYDDPQVIASKLHINEDFSAENYSLEIFTRHGILTGCLFLVFFSFIIVSSWNTTKIYINIQHQFREDNAFVIAVFAIFISLFLMAQSSLFRNNLILWIMIGFISVIKQQNLKQGHEE